MKRWIVRHDTSVFLLLAFGISWPLWFASGTLTRTPVRAADLSWLVAQIGVFAPAFAAMVIGACVEPGGARRALRLLGLVYLPAVALAFWIATRGFGSFLEIDARSTWAMNAFAIWVLASFGASGNRPVTWPGAPASRIQTALWSAGALFVPSALFLGAWAMTGGSAPGSSGIPTTPARAMKPFGLLSALSINLAYGGSLGEEPGWRGAWLPRLLGNHTPLAASLIISFWWALWHAPIDFSQGFGYPGAGALIVRQVWTLPVTVLFTWVTLRAGGSLLPPILLHTSLNTIPDFVLGQPARYERSLALLFLFLAFTAVLAALNDPRLRKAPGKGQTARSL